MKKYWIIGHPLAFCLTTPVMNRAFRAQGVEASFETQELMPEDLPKVMDMLKKGELAGVVATMPFKTPSIAYLDEMGEEVKKINAVNLIVNEGGRLKGWNTDYLGAMGAITAVMPNLKGKKALVLGAGGAARAAAYGLKKEGASVFIWNRTAARAQEAAQSLGLTCLEDLNAWGEEPDLIINATAHSDQARQSTLVPFRLWRTVKLALDAVYGKTSLFLEEAKAAQVPYVISGEVWFLKQTVPMFERITGQKAPIELMARLINYASS